MRFLIDVSAASRAFQDALISQGHDVLSAVDINPALDDETLLAIANDERRIMLTEDKDFGELVFARGLPHHGVIRFSDANDETKIAAMNDLISEHSDTLLTGNAIVVVAPNGLRISRSPTRQPPSALY